MSRHGIAPSIRGDWFPQGYVPEAGSPCKRGCCWSPYGHSSAAVGCHCHDKATETRGINQPADVNTSGEGLGGDNKLGPQMGVQREREER